MKPALVLLPGMDGTGELFAPFVDAIGSEADVRVIRYPAAMSSYVELEQYVRELLPDDKPFILLGESFSGPVAIAVAATRPPGLTGLVLCCTFARCPVPYASLLGGLASWLPVKAVPARVVSSLLLGRYFTKGMHARLRAALAQVPATTLRRRLRAVLTVDVSRALTEVAVPLLYLRAAHDRLVGRSAARHIESVAPHTRAVPLDAPHFLLQVKPDEAAVLIGSFLLDVAREGEIDRGLVRP